ATNKTQTSISKKRPYVARFTFKQSAVSSSARYGLTKRIASGGQMSRENDGFEFHPTRLQRFLDVAYRFINVFDNEKWAHATVLAPFRIARAPVTNAEFAAFVENSGYRAREFWSAPGGAGRETRQAERPVYWQAKRDGVWTARHYRAVEELRPHAPVIFVNWFEAEAWCRWAGRRLASETDWEARE